MSVSHPPITEVAVFSVKPLGHISIGIYCVVESEIIVFWHQFSLRRIDKWKSWYEYRIVGWMKQFPTCLVENSCCVSKRKGDKYLSTTFFESSDCYGYYREPDSDRIGYSVKEGEEFFVNYLAPPLVWESTNHHAWPPQFRAEVWCILLSCKRLGGPWRNLKYLLIGQLSQLANIRTTVELGES